MEINFLNNKKNQSKLTLIDKSQDIICVIMLTRYELSFLLFCALCDISTDVWNHIHNVLLPKYSQQLNGVNVMSGPIFDKDFDGNVDPLEASSG